jgi:hypothetical protein
MLKDLSADSVGPLRADVCVGDILHPVELGIMHGIPARNGCHIRVHAEHSRAEIPKRLSICEDRCCYKCIISPYRLVLSILLVDWVLYVVG